jgi:pyruvate,water dikinase
MTESAVLVKGEPASAGIARGVARHILSPADMGKMEDGNVLVAPLTNPQLMGAILRACAIVTEMGGILSHAAIVSREFGIPCVVGARGATEIIQEGMEVTVDGSAGLVLR